MTCISTQSAYQTGYHLYDLRPEILVNPYQAAQVCSHSVLWHGSAILTHYPDGLGLSNALHSGLCLYEAITSDNISPCVFLYRVHSDNRTDLSQGIFPGKTNKYFCYTLMVYETIWAISSFFLTLFQCSPVSSYWLIQST
jgi:hypothetical protein